MSFIRYASAKSQPDGSRCLRSGREQGKIRIATGQGGQVQHRVTYVAKFAEAVYVLHAFQKTTEKTSTHDIELARMRYHGVIQARMTS